ncbi:GAF domain-containing serine/threonine-protein kinase [Arthrobacter sulfonylureivorans]|uniref:GAF domain-containing serine/threonine-protein kinase n=1 Tax=Arthrobacter sulfonylureivorans TaxID=2486855 RepID=UPI0039E4E62C
MLLNGRYRLINLVGTGANAKVYRAEDQVLGREVAVKVIQRPSMNEEEFHHDDAEIKLLARLNHGNLVTLLDAGIDRIEAGHPQIYLVMEMIEGADLKARLKAGPMPPLHVAQIGHDLAEGLAYIHTNSVVHRDVKPGNIMLFNYDDDGARLRAKLTDFGIAVVISEDAHVSGMYGTAAYLSPEQAKGEPAGPASDIYALGLVLLECLTGVTTFPGPPLEAAVARLLRDPEIPSELGPEWVPLLTAMTAREPEARPTGRDVALALSDLALSLRGRHKEVSILPVDEPLRMEAVQRYNILDTPPDATLDRITAMVARLFSAPIAAISVVDHDRIWFKSHHGLGIQQIDREPGLCGSTILQNGPWIINNAPADPRAAANSLVAGGFGLKFYAGVPLKTREGFNLGTLCVMDFEPRDFSAEDTLTLEDLAAVVMNSLELQLDSGRHLPAEPLAS